MAEMFRYDGDGTFTKVDADKYVGATPDIDPRQDTLVRNEYLAQIQLNGVNQVSNIAGLRIIELAKLEVLKSTRAWIIGLGIAAVIIIAIDTLMDAGILLWPM